MIDYEKLVKAKSKYDGIVGNLESRLFDKILFDFNIGHHESDGFVVLNIDSSDVAHLEDVLFHLKKYNTLSVEQHKDICI